MTTPAPDVYVVGAGGHAREVHSYITDIQKSGEPIVLKGFLDDHLEPGSHGRLDVLGNISSLRGNLPGHARFITALGTNAVRRDVVAHIRKRTGDTLPAWTLIHPTAITGEDVEIGAGTCLAPSAIVTANTRIGRHVIINIRASVSHDCSVGDFVNINPGAVICGWVTIGEGAYIGAGAVIKDRISIGAWSTIGAGAVVIRDVPENAMVAGVPARPIKTAQKH